MPPVEDFIKNPIPTKVNCFLKEFISPDFISFAFIQGDSRVVFQHALPLHLLVFYLFIVLGALHTPPANFTGPGSDQTLIFPAVDFKGFTMWDF